MEVDVVVGAGLDVHKKRIVACCLDGRSNPVKVTRNTFGTYRHELEKLRDWLVGCGCTHVAMESTGIYWVPVYRVLEGSVDIVLGNARHMANVPGRKTDVNDARWIAELLRHGLIKRNFVPPAPIRQLRQLTRYRRKLVGTRSSCQLRVEKLLQSTNIKLSSVASEVFGVSGRLMLGALASGVTDPTKLAELARGKLRNKRADLRLAFNGTFTDQDARLLDIQLGVIEQLDQKIVDLERLIGQQVTPYEDVLVRLQTVPGIGRTIAVEVLAEMGTDLSVWPSDNHFAAWSGTCAGNRESAGIRRKARSREGNPYLKSILCQAATSAVRTHGSYLSTRYGRIKSRRGEARATLAIARELACSIYHVMRRVEAYRAPAIADPAVAKERRSQRLIRELRKLGYEVQKKG
jgi:transposase